MSFEQFSSKMSAMQWVDQDDIKLAWDNVKHKKMIIRGVPGGHQSRTGDNGVDEVAIPRAMLAVQANADGSKVKLSELQLSPTDVNASQADALKSAIESAELLPMESFNLLDYSTISSMIQKIKSVTTAKDMEKCQAEIHIQESLLGQ
eukprot:4108202-Pyramimonas_sp.AAC.1